MRGLRSTIALLAVLIGLGAYIYFVVSDAPESGTDHAGTRVRRTRRRHDRRAQGQVGNGRNDEREERRGGVADDGAARRKGE